jgi:hypothetical protein
LSPEQRQSIEPAVAALTAVDPKASKHLEGALEAYGLGEMGPLIGPSEEISWLLYAMLCTDSDGDINKFAFCGGLLALTDQNLMFAGTADGGSTRSGRWALKELSTVDLVRDRALGDVLLVGTGGAAQTGFTMKHPAAAQELVNRLRAGITRARATPVAAAPSSVADELAKLASLRDGGVLTEQEFAARKARLLSQ